MREIIDAEDLVMLGRGVALYILGAVAVFATAAVLGVAVRVFQLAGGL